MINVIRGYQADLNDAKRDMKRIWGEYTVHFHTNHEIDFWTVVYHGDEIRDHVRVVFVNQPTYGQYLMVMSVLAKPNDTAFVLCQNISKLTLWSDK